MQPGAPAAARSASASVRIPSPRAHVKPAPNALACLCPDASTGIPVTDANICKNPGQPLRPPNTRSASGRAPHAAASFSSDILASQASPS